MSNPRSPKRPRLQLEVVQIPENDDEASTEEQTISSNENLKKHPLDVFPEEIWIMIAERVDDTDDFQSLLNSSLLLRPILSSLKTLKLFPNVWKVLGSRFENAMESWYNENEYTRTRKPFSEILALRLVCPAWCNTVDRWFESAPCLFKREKYDVCQNRVIFNRTDPMTSCYNFHLRRGRLNTPLSVITDFKEAFNQSHLGSDSVAKRNPFIGRSCSFSTHQEAPIQALLSQYGHHLSFCHVLQIGSPFDENQYYLEQKRSLALMPNLTALNIYWTPFYDRVRTPEQRIRLEQTISTNPMPTLANLKFLKIRSMAPSIFNEMIRRNNHVSKLEIERTLEDDDYDIHSVPMPNLTELAVSFNSDSGFLKLADPRVNWCLTKLYLELNTDVMLDWSLVFLVLENKWANSLTELAISLPPRQARTIESQLRLNCIKVLKVTLSDYHSLDFILPMADTVEQLHVNVVPDGEHAERIVLDQQMKLEAERGQQLNILSCFDNPLDSNVWDLFPKVKRIEYLEGRVVINYDGCNGRNTDFVEKAGWTHNRLERNRRAPVDV